MHRLPLFIAAALAVLVLPLIAWGESSSPKSGVEVLFSAVGEKSSPSLVNEPFSVDFAADGTIYGVEFTKANRIYKIGTQGKVEFIAGQFWNSERKGADNTPNDGL